MTESKIVETVVKREVPLMRNTLPGNRHKELKYYCLQYAYYKYCYEGCLDGTFSVERYAKDNDLKQNDPTFVTTVIRERYGLRMDNIHDALKDTVPEDEELRNFLFRAVTEGIGYKALAKDGLKMPQMDFWQLRIDFFHNLNKYV